MSKEDRNALIAWVDAGSPEGDTANLPEPKTYPSQHFTIGEPDHIIRMPQEFDVPADGVVDYQYFMIEQEVKEDLWIQKAEAIMDSPAVHHIILFWVPPGGDPRKNRNMLVGTAPGDMPLDLPDGMAIHVPKGSRFLIEMHYTPIGRPVTDRSFIGLIKAKEEVDRVVYGNPMGRHDFSIPPGKADHKEISKFNVLEDIEVVSFMPHMHVRGKSWKYTALYPDGREEVLLYVPNYDFNWQSVYMYEKNPVLPKGTTIVCEAVWDNSAENPYNPDPAKTVRYGEQTWEEMMFGFMQYVHVDKKFQDNRALSRMDGKKKRKRS